MSRALSLSLLAGLAVSSNAVGSDAGFGVVVTEEMAQEERVYSPFVNRDYPDQVFFR